MLIAIAGKRGRGLSGSSPTLQWHHGPKDPALPLILGAHLSMAQASMYKFALYKPHNTCVHSHTHHAHTHPNIVCTYLCSHTCTFTCTQNLLHPKIFEKMTYASKSPKDFLTAKYSIFISQMTHHWSESFQSDNLSSCQDKGQGVKDKKEVIYSAHKSTMKP